MIYLRIWVEGTGAILLHRATEEALSNKTRTNTIEAEEDPRTIAGKAVYRLPGGQIALPGAAFARMLREAGGSHKARGTRKSVKYIVPAAVLVTDEMCGLYLRDRKTAIKDFEVDSRPVTIPATKGRVMRHRARLNEWAAPVNCRLVETIMSADMLRTLFIDGGQQIGIGDYRPEKGGPFGTFDVVAWDVLSDPKPKTEAQIRNSGRRVKETPG
jgi:hypothetical protein